jgi:hypothetical protein
MKFRVLAGTMAMAMLLSATACGTGNLANNAYGANRTTSGIVRDGNAGRGTVQGKYVGRNYNFDGIGNTTGRGMNDFGRGTTTVRRYAGSRRLGNALHNTRNTFGNGRAYDTSGFAGRADNNRGVGVGIPNNAAGRLTNNIGRTNTGQIRQGVNINYDGTAYDGTPNGMTTARGTDGRITHQSRNTGAYSDQRNFQNTVYRRQDNVEIVDNTVTNRGATQRIDGPGSTTPQNSVNRGSTAQNNIARNNTAINTQDTTNRNNGRTMVRDMADNAVRYYQLDNSNFNRNNNNTNQIHRNGNSTRYEGSVHHLNQNGPAIADNARQLRGDRNQFAQNGYLISDNSAFDGIGIIRDGRTTPQNRNTATAGQTTGRNAAGTATIGQAQTANRTANRPINRTAVSPATTARTTAR